MRNPNQYQPKQGDIVIIDFDPSVGKEIQKIRPAIVVSADSYNVATGFIAVCPITSTEKSYFVALEDTHKTHGFINPLQLKTFDFLDSRRKVRFIEKATINELAVTAQRVKMMFKFDELFGE